MKPRVTRELQAQRASICLKVAADYLTSMLPDLTMLVLVAQVASDEGPVDVALSYPKGLEGDAAAVAREAAQVFDRQASA